MANASTVAADPTVQLRDGKHTGFYTYRQMFMNDHSDNEHHVYLINMLVLFIKMYMY